MIFGYVKRAIIWVLQSHICLLPFALILVGAYIFLRFIPHHAALLVVLWVIIVSVVYIKYNRWY